MNLLVWSERLSYKDLVAPAVLDLLRRYDVTLGVQVTPARRAHDGDALLALIRLATDFGVPLALWPRLSDDDPGVHERNVEAFSDLVGELLDWMQTGDARVRWIVVDLQLPRHQAERYVRASGLGWAWLILRLMRSNLNRQRFMTASARLQSLKTRIADYGAGTIARILDQVAADLTLGGIAWQDFLETPVTTVAWELVLPTYYSSLVIGSGIAPADAQGLLYQVCQATHAHYGDRAGVSLGLCGVESGSAYATPAELQPDVAAALAAGIQEIALSDLAGIIASPDPAAWFQAVRSCAPAAPAVTAWARRSFENRQRMARLMAYFQ